MALDRILNTPTIVVDQDKYDDLIKIQDRYNQIIKQNKANMKTKVEPEYIDKIINEAEIEVESMMEKCTVVTVKLKNGFVITESSACVDTENYNKEIGEQICIGKIKNRLWELEGYKLQDKLYKEDK